MQSNKIRCSVKFYCLFFFVLSSQLNLSAQDSLSMDYGQVTAADFGRSLPEFSSDASAIILADIGRTYYEPSKNAYIGEEMVNIQMQMRLKLNKTSFPVEDYTSLREFFGDVLKKETEQIVFKKIK